MTEPIPAFDLYGELEVSERASLETIQAAYRSLQLRHHPDRVGAGAGERATRLNIARDWLVDPERRARYDAALADARRQAEASRTGDGRAGETTTAGAAAAEAEPGADDEVDDEPEDGASMPTGRAVRVHLRLDVGRLARIWIVGLAFIGALTLLSGLDAHVSVLLAVVVLLVLLALGTRLLRSDGSGGIRAKLARAGWTVVGWIRLALLGVEGVSEVVSVARGSRAAPADAIGPLLVVVAVASVLAIRRQPGPAFATVEEFLEMTPTEFEASVGQVLGRHGYRLQPTGGPGDLVADLVGTDSRGRLTVVQCKRYAPGHPVGSRDVQLLIAMGLRHHGAERLVLVTTSDFTDPAVDLAEAHDVRLIAGDELEALTR